MLLWPLTLGSSGLKRMLIQSNQAGAFLLSILCKAIDIFRELVLRHKVHGHAQEACGSIPQPVIKGNFGTSKENIGV